MKKVLLFVLSFFMFIPSAFATNQITSMDINATIDKSGNAEFVETWKIPPQSNTKFEKVFYNQNKLKIKDYKVEAQDLTELKKVKKNNDSPFTFYVDNKKGREKIHFNLSKEETTVIIKYTVENFVNEYSDTFGIDWFFYVNPSVTTVGKINILLTTPNELTESNTALYSFGNNISGSFNNGKIEMFASNVSVKSKMRMMTSFTEMELDSYNKIDESFKETYNQAKNTSPIIIEIMDMLEEENDKLIIIALFLVGIIVGLVVVIKAKNTNKEYANITTFTGKTLEKISDVFYCDTTPCSGNYYEVAFLADYYGIINNKSNLISALLFKWYINESIELKEKDGKYSIVFIKEPDTHDEYEKKLYGILEEGSVKGELDNTRAQRFANDNEQAMNEWYHDVIKYILNNEQTKNNVHIKRKKKHSIITLNSKLISEGTKILGLKKYLMNFNQVPRNTELTDEIYTSLLISSEILGIGKNLSEEILRKSPDNIKATKLKEFQNVRQISKHLFITSDKNKKKYKYYDIDKA